MLLKQESDHAISGLNLFSFFLQMLLRYIGTLRLIHPACTTRRPLLHILLHQSFNFLFGELFDLNFHLYCTGQTGYTMHILDEIIDKMVRQIFSRLRGIPKEQLITSRYAKETAERKNHLQALQAERDKAEKDLLALKTEILAVIKGESAFPKDTLAEMIAAQEKKHTELETLCEEASAELERNAELMANVSQLYEELISYADLYDSASFEAKKMIVSQLIRRVEVYRGYQIHVDFNFDLAQYLENSDELAC